MGGLVDDVLDFNDPAGFFKGLSGQTAAEGTERALQFQREAAEAQRLQQERARQDVLDLFPSAQNTLQQGFQSALDVFGQSVPMQANLFQSGNVGAQQALLSGLPQFQNAILGAPVDFSQISGANLSIPDLSFLQASLPTGVSPISDIAQREVTPLSAIGGSPAFPASTSGLNVAPIKRVN